MEKKRAEKGVKLCVGLLVPGCRASSRAISACITNFLARIERELRGSHQVTSQIKQHSLQMESEGSMGGSLGRSQGLLADLHWCMLRVESSC